MSLPIAVKELSLTDLNGEVLVYNGVTNRAACLSKVGGLVLQACIDSRSRQDLLKAIAEIGVSDPEVVLEETLSQLASEGLLEDVKAGEFDRRRFLTAAGAALAVPVLVGVAAPRASEAASCRLCNVDAGGVPLDCTDCGKNCRIVGPTCAVNTPNRCCFEYTLNLVVWGGNGTGGDGTGNNTINGEPDGAGPGNASAPTPVTVGDDFCSGDSVEPTYQAEGSGDLDCRNMNGRFFHPDCATARALAVAAGSVSGENYYCCDCPRAATDRRCP